MRWVRRTCGASEFRCRRKQNPCTTPHPKVFVTPRTGRRNLQCERMWQVVCGRCIVAGVSIHARLLQPSPSSPPALESAMLVLPQKNRGAEATPKLSSGFHLEIRKSGKCGEPFGSRQACFTAPALPATLGSVSSAPRDARQPFLSRQHFPGCGRPWPAPQASTRRIQKLHPP